jgi:hypothetical protein
MGLTQPPIEMSTRKPFWGVKRRRRVRLTTSPPSVCWLSRKCGMLHIRVSALYASTACNRDSFTPPPPPRFLTSSSFNIAGMILLAVNVLRASRYSSQKPCLVALCFFPLFVQWLKYQSSSVQKTTWQCLPRQRARYGLYSQTMPSLQAAKYLWAYSWGYKFKTFCITTRTLLVSRGCLEQSWLPILVL